jgi:cytochrome oxidase Cu insertion factor (SCO1/SenC/PrrC family)
MPGMNSALSPASPILVDAFRSALLHQWLIIAFVFVLLLITWGASRTAIFGSITPPAAAAGVQRWREPRARLLLRVGFGLIWIFDGILQAQSQMPGGLADQVMQPAASSSPGWVQHLVNYGVNLWDYHPIQAAAASVWIQIGIGLWMLLAVRGWSSRLAGLSGVAWGLIVWAFGEAFGGIFAPGLTVLFGAPGAVLIYVVAGALLALPERAWDTPRLSRFVLGGVGVFFLGMALLQAWPGRGFWQGKAGGQLGTLSSMIASMVSTPQPHPLDAIVRGFGNFTVAHGFAVNLVAVIALAVIGAGFVIGAVRPDARRLALIAVIAGAVFCLADWILIEDFGFLGGLGTDPNSMVPFILLFTAGYLGLAPVPATVPAAEAAEAAVDVPEPAGATKPPGVSEPAGVPELTEYLAAPTSNDVPAAEADDPEPTGASPAGDVPELVGASAMVSAAEPAKEPGPGEGVPAPVPSPRRAWQFLDLVRGFAGTPMRLVAAIGAFAVVLVGAAPMAFATTNPNADPITAEAISGTIGQFDTPASNFTLTSQDGRQVSLASLRGKVVLLTFLDPVCTTDCPLIAQEMRSADTLLGAKASDTELVAVVANPTYTSIAYTKEFTSEENLAQVPNWLYLTGSVSQLTAIWNAYGITVEDLPAGAMVAHNDIAIVISANGTITQELSDDPGPGTAASKSSFASLLADSVLQTMGQS